MQRIEWDPQKNRWLQQKRGISFEEIKDAIARKKIIDIQPHPGQTRYKHQHIFLIAIREYVYVVPFVEDDRKIFLKTAFPSRKMTKKYLQK